MGGLRRKSYRELYPRGDERKSTCSIEGRARKIPSGSSLLAEHHDMTLWTRRIPFKVDVAGIIEIMGTSLYSRADIAIRELIQNAHDAVVRRRHRDLGYQGRIDIEQDPAAHLLKFHDDGIGLSPEEAEEFLSTLGTGITGM